MIFVVRLSHATVLLGLLASVLIVSAEASRKPTTTERRQVTRAVLVEVERDSPTFPTRVSGVRITTIRNSATSPYSKFAYASVSGYNERGEPIGDSTGAVLGYSKRYRAWAMIGYGSSDFVCGREDLPLFGGQRPAILRDLGLPPCSR